MTLVDAQTELFCDICQLTFQRRDHHQRHLRTHTKEKPFSCSQCGQTFARIDSLARHHTALHLDPDHQDPIPSRRRVAQACRACSTSKVRCDGQRPCRRCRRQHSECHYAPHSKRKASEASLDRSMAQPKTAKATHSPRSPLSAPVAAHNSASGVTRADTLVVPEQYRVSLPRQDNMPPIEPLLETSDSSSRANHVHVPFDVGDMFLDFHSTNNTATPSLFLGDTFGSHNWLDYNINETVMPFLLQDDPSLEAINNRGLDQAELGCLLPTALPDPPASATMAQSDVAELYSRSHSPAIDQDAVEPRQYHPVSIEVDAQLIFPDMAQVPTEDVDQENLAHVDQVSDDVCDKMTQAATELQRTAYFPPFMHLRIPPGPIVNAWVQLYFEYFHPIMPILHKATFSSPKRHWLLIFTVAAIGAQFSGMKESLACSRAMHELVRRKTSAMCEQLNSVARELWMTQSILLNHIGLMYAGERRSLELAEILQALLTTLGRKKRLFTDMFPMDKFAKLQLPLTQKWQIWLLDEERRRAGFAIWLLDSAYDSHFDLSRLMKLSELQISLPQPDGRWGASTAQTWAGFPSLEANSLPTMEKLIASNAWKSVWPQTNTFGKQVMLQHLTDIIKDQNATQFGVPGFSDHDKLLAANVLTELLALEDNDNRERSIDEVKSATTHQIITLSALTMHNTPTPNLLSTVVQFIYGKLETPEWAQLRDKWSAFSTQGRLGCFYAARILQVVRCSHCTYFGTPVSLLRAVLVLWLYSALSERFGDDFLCSAPGPVVVLGPKPLDNVDTTGWVDHGWNRVSLPGIGNFLRTQGRLRLLDDAIVLMQSLKAWGISSTYAHILFRVRASEHLQKEVH